MPAEPLKTCPDGGPRPGPPTLYDVMRRAGCALWHDDSRRRTALVAPEQQFTFRSRQVWSDWMRIDVYGPAAGLTAGAREGDAGASRVGPAAAALDGFRGIPGFVELPAPDPVHALEGAEPVVCPSGFPGSPCGQLVVGQNQGKYLSAGKSQGPSVQRTPTIIRARAGDCSDRVAGLTASETHPKTAQR